MERWDGRPRRGTSAVHPSKPRTTQYIILICFGPYIGKDATESFEDVGHSDEARELLKGLLVGTFDGGDVRLFSVFHLLFVERILGADTG